MNVFTVTRLGRDSQTDGMEVNLVVFIQRKGTCTTPVKQGKVEVKRRWRKERVEYARTGKISHE